MKFLFLLIFLYPRAEILPGVFDAGKVLEGDKIRVDFKVKNKGDEPLEIIDVKKSCGCTFVGVEKLKIMPSDSTFLKAVIRAEGKKDEFEEEIMVETNDPYEPYIRLKIKAHVYPFPKPEVKSVKIIDMGNLYPGEVKDTFFYVENKGDAELVLLEATPSASCEITSDFPIHITPGKKKLIDIEVIPIKTGILDEEIRIATNIKEYLYHFIKIKGRVYGNYLSLTSPLVFKKNDTLYILNNGKKNIFIEKVLINKKVLVSKINLKPEQKFRIILPDNIDKNGEIEINFKFPYILK